MEEELKWLVDGLIRNERVEDGPELEKPECQQILNAVVKKLGCACELIVNINIERNGIFYDYLIDHENIKESRVLIEEWDNRYL